MLTRRLFASCALCAATGLVATEVVAQSTPAMPGLKRTMLSQSEGPMEGYVTLLMQVDIDPGTMVMRHTHPGIESTFVLEGGGTLSVKGRADLMLAPGTGTQVPANTPHALRNGDKTTRLAITYIVEKGKPLATPAPE